MRAITATLAVLLLVPGCVSETLTGADAPTVVSTRPLAETSLEWTEAGGARAPLGEPVLVPEGAGALFVEYAATITGPLGFLDIVAVAPDGTEHAVAAAGSTFSRAFEASDFEILAAAPGEWSFTAESARGSTGTLNVTVLPAVRPLEAVRGNGPDRVVVAAVDTGVNPHHDVFQTGLESASLPARVVDAHTGAGPLSVPLARGEDHLATVKASAAAWAAVPPERLVHFEGTNVLGYRLDEGVGGVLDRAGHGTMVLNSVVAENPDVLVVMISGENYDDGVRWAAAQPWIDVITLSWGPPVNAAGPVGSAAFGFVTPEATLEAHRAGKIVFTASGNDPTPTFTDTTSGPPWVHAVSGAEAALKARALSSGNFVDTVSNWTQELARYDSLDETEVASGTSFATPTTAGIASRVLHEARALGLAPTSADVRAALNASAVYWSTTEWDPSDPTGSPPIAPAPWVSMGWGFLDGSSVAPAVAMLQGTPPEPKPAGAEEFMAANLALRERWWASR